MGRLVISHSGAEARAHAYSGQWGTMDGPYSQGYDYDVWGNVTHKYGWGGEVQGGSPGVSTDINYAYTGNRRNGFSYDAAGNLTNDLGQTFTYDATGQQATASYSGYSLQQSYDGDGLRVKKSDNGTVTYYLRSTVLGGQVAAEITGGGALQRSYIYLGSQLLALRQANGYNYWVHQDPVTKSKRVTDMFGAAVSTIELDPWGADTNRSSNGAFQPKKFTSYERDSNGTDEAMFRRYNRWQSRFDQPDPYEGSYDYTNPQSFNRYAYVQGDPVNFVDPSGLFMVIGDSDCQFLWEGWQRIMGTGIEEFGQFLPGCVTNSGGTGEGSRGGGGGGGPAPGFDKELGDPPLPPCTFNINITGVSGQQLTDMQNEMTRIFASGGFAVVFGHPELANASSMNLAVTSQYFGAIAQRLGSAANDRSIFGYTQGSDSQVNSTNIFAVLNPQAVPPLVRGENLASYGTVFGRVGAHEAIAHALTGGKGDPFLPPDVRSTGINNPGTLGNRNNLMWNIGEDTANALKAKCP